MTEETKQAVKEEMAKDISEAKEKLMELGKNEKVAEAGKKMSSFFFSKKVLAVAGAIVAIVLAWNFLYMTPERQMEKSAVSFMEAIASLKEDPNDRDRQDKVINALAPKYQEGLRLEMDMKGDISAVKRGGKVLKYEVTGVNKLGDSKGVVSFKEEIQLGKQVVIVGEDVTVEKVDGKWYVSHITNRGELQ